MTTTNSASAPVRQVLLCVSCGRMFDRPSPRGRKPGRCPDCRRRKRPPAPPSRLRKLTCIDSSKHLQARSGTRKAARSHTGPHRAVRSRFCLAKRGRRMLLAETRVVGPRRSGAALGGSGCPAILHALGRRFC